MAAVATAGATRPSRGLPDEIAIWEILVHLPPNALLRCRAVCRAWRRATTTCDFLLPHHARQPTLLMRHGDQLSLDIISFDHRAAADQLRTVARFGGMSYSLVACCDGFFVLAVNRAHFGISMNMTHFSIYNPATHQYASLSMLSGLRLLGMYHHPATGEYRLLMHHCQWSEPGRQVGSYVFSLGPGQPLRHIGKCLDANELSNISVLFRGCLHWYRMKCRGKSCMIIVLDTIAESFRQMCPPNVSGCVDLFDMDGMLGMSNLNYSVNIIEVWVLQDYESEVWTFMYQIELPFTEIRAQCGYRQSADIWSAVVVPEEGELLVMVRFNEWLIQVDMDGKLVATFHCRGVVPIQFLLKQTLVPHTFFPTLEGYVVNHFPLI
ncbi:hypothetical protein TRIUR3_21306 [Triticum urartu]|uniref:Uncharacterized protein n=1 Tax=Triticum urartu TaxID=4572 RepID=M7YHZ9_TRIUA|nr:hypothetical protein TRIUR3_21306 [Triticum urartu]